MFLFFRRLNFQIVSTAILSLILMSAQSSAQVWESAAQHSGSTAWYAPTYPLLFVSYKINEQVTPGVCNGNALVGHSQPGIDVIDMVLPKKGGELFILLTNGQVKRLFPLPSHQAIVDAPIGTAGNINGTVMEPSMAINGHDVLFSYVHDTTTSNNGVGYSLGADIYRMELSQLLANSQFNPANLPIQRLTQTTAANKFDHAMNGPLASNGSNGYGNSYFGATEINTFFGHKLIFASDIRRLLNSNMTQGNHNRNFSLYEATINPDNSLGELQQFQYYTTTSALSPTRIRNGVAYSYQSTTETNRQWQIQVSDSAGKWGPAYGYGIRTALAHNTTFCRKTTASGLTDFLLTTSYYNVNNNGYGAIISQNMSVLGTNNYDVKTVQGSKLPYIVGSTNITNNVSDIHDDPSDKAPNGQYYGKFATPACAEPDRFYASYSPTSANDRLCDDDGNKSIYRGMIVTRDNLNAFDPVSSPAKIVVRDVNFDQVGASARYGAVWPVPVVSHQFRTGDVDQQYSLPAFNVTTGITPGDPFAEVGTSALYNTDVTAPDCKVLVPNGAPFSPNHTSAVQDDAVIMNVANLTRVPNPAGFCDQPTAQQVLGVKIFLTSNEANQNASGVGAGYETAQTNTGGKPQESKKLLGTYSIAGQADSSFKARIPANAPFDLHLVDKYTGLKLVDVTSWHSLKPGELRADCGGCHNHKANTGIPWQGTVASTSPAQNLTSSTQYIDYGLGCQVQMKTSNTATRGLPEWKQDIFPGFDRNCGGCHSATGTNPQAAQARLAFQYGPENGDPAEEVLYHRLRARNFIFPEIGALSSPAFWAAIGSRTDGRNNSIYSSAGSQFKANYVSCQDSGKDKDCGFQFYSGHAGACNISVTDAQWVYSFGDWIDNHAPRDTGTTASYIKDRFHPSIDGALSDPNCSISDHLRIGYWDDSGQLKKVEVMLNGVQVAVYSNISNGAKLMDLSSFGLNSSDTLSVKATDPADNTQSYEKSVQDLVLECMARSGYVPPPPTPSPSPTPTSTPNPSPTPGEQEIILSVNTTEPVLGGRLKFNVNTNLPNGDFVIVGTITNERGRSYIQAPWNVILPNFVSDFVTNRTLKLFRGRLENSPKIQITIPNGPSSQWLLGNTFRFVALVQSPEGTIASNPVSLQFQVGGGQNIINGGKPHRKHGKRFRKSRKRGVALIKAAKLSRKSIIK